MEPLLEQQRRHHEERERLLDAMVGEALVKQQGQPVVNPASTMAAAAAAAGGGVAPTFTSSLARKPLSHRDSLNSDHRVRAMLDRYTECSRTLLELYEDKDGLRREEVAALSGPNEFQEFYSRLKQIKEFHRRHPGEAISVPMAIEFDELKKVREGTGAAAAENDPSQVMVEFTGK
jgi:splicing factor 3A subunit 3